MKLSRLPSAVIMYREGILIIELAGKIISSKEANDQVKAAKKITGNNCFPVIIIDHSPATEITREAEEIFQQEFLNGTILTQAFVTVSLSKKLKANLHSRMYPKGKFKVFSNFNSAWKWSFSNINKS